MVNPGDYVYTFDLKSGYHHLDIYNQHWMYILRWQYTIKKS